MASSGSSNAGPKPSSAGSVSFKAYLSKKGADKPMEVRRFGVEQNEVTSFELLKSKLRLVFPNLKGHEFTIGWKDFENDEIIISSNDELITFLTETNDQVRRLYLTINNHVSISIEPYHVWPSVDSALNAAAAMASAGGNDTDEEDDEEEDDLQYTPLGCKRPWQSSLKSNLKFHPHVYCDGCQKHIPGNRYKCLECPDFDLCIDCESQNMHKEHVMLRIPLSMSHYPKLNNFAKGMHYMSEALRKIENRMKKQERRMNKMCDIASPNFCDLADMIPHSKRCKRDDKEKDKSKDDKREKQDKRERKCRKEKECGSTASAGCGADASASSSAKAGCPFPSGLLSSFLNPQTLGNLLSPQNLNTLQQLFEHMSPVPEQLLQEVAQNLADVRLSDPAPSAPAAGSSTPTNPFSVNTKKPSAPEADGAVPSTSSAPQSPVAAHKAAEKQAAQTESSAPASARPNGPNGPNASGSSTPVSVSGRSSRSSSEEADAEGWTVVDAHLKEASGEQQPSVYPKLPVAEPTPAQTPAAVQPAVPVPMPILHRDPEVQKCLRALAEMGFDVHQQMIVQLAVEYKGNVGRVLSALVP